MENNENPFTSGGDIPITGSGAIRSNYANVTDPDGSKSGKTSSGRDRRWGYLTFHVMINSNKTPELGSAEFQRIESALIDTWNNLINNKIRSVIKLLDGEFNTDWIQSIKHGGSTELSNRKSANGKNRFLHMHCLLGIKTRARVSIDHNFLKGEFNKACGTNVALYYKRYPHALTSVENYMMKYNTIQDARELTGQTTDYEELTLDTYRPGKRHV